MKAVGSSVMLLGRLLVEERLSALVAGVTPYSKSSMASSLAGDSSLAY